MVIGGCGYLPHYIPDTDIIETEYSFHRRGMMVTDTDTADDERIDRALNVLRLMADDGPRFGSVARGLRAAAGDVAGRSINQSEFASWLGWTQGIVSQVEKGRLRLSRNRAGQLLRLAEMLRGGRLPVAGELAGNKPQESPK